MTNKGKFTSEYQPKKGRGKSERTKWIEALKEKGHSEQAFYNLVIDEAMNEKSAMAVGEILRRISPIPKQVAPSINFELNKKALPHEKAIQILDAVSDGIIPPDIGVMLINSIKSLVDIEEYTALKERIQQLEATINGG